MSDDDDSTPNVTSKFQTFLLNTKRILTISTKPTRKEYMQMLKICSVAMAIVGVLSFIIQIIAAMVQPKPEVTTTTT